MLNISEFVEVLEALLISTEESAIVNKLTKFKIIWGKISVCLCVGRNESLASLLRFCSEMLMFATSLQLGMLS